MKRNKGQAKVVWGPLNQRRPFQVVLDEGFKRNLQEHANRTGRTYHVFFTTSGQARVESVGVRSPLYKPILEIKPKKL